MVLLVVSILVGIAVSVYLLALLYLASAEESHTCYPSYFTNCKSNFDCSLQTECELGRGIMCYPECYSQGVEMSCLLPEGKCIWIHDGTGPL